MNRSPHVSLFFTLSAAVLACGFLGCHNRNNCGGGGLFANNGRIAPPATYSLNIPSIAGNQPYYQPNGGPISTTARAPIPAGSSQNNSSNLQWRPAGTNNFGFQQQPNVSPSSNRLVEINRGVIPAAGTLAGGFQNGVRPASAFGPLPATGDSFTNSRNFATTRIDERLDDTRIPVTDATQVRATAQNFVAGGSGTRPNPVFTPQQTFAAQPIPAQQVFATNGFIVPAQPQNFVAQTFVQSPNRTASASNAVGWRGRELGSQSRQ